MSLPYASSTSGRNALEETRKLLQSFGCSKFAPLEDFYSGTVTIQFEYRQRMVQVTASAKGYASAWLKTTPHTDRMKKTRLQHEEAALKQGQIAVWSILRDWIKGQLMAIETGILSFDAAFLGQVLLPDGRTVHQHIEERGMLPALTDQRPNQPPARGT